MDQISGNSESQSMQHSQFSGQINSSMANKNFMIKRWILDFNILYENLYRLNEHNIKVSDVSYTHFEFNPFFYNRQNNHNLSHSF